MTGTRFPSMIALTALLLAAGAPDARGGGLLLSNRDRSLAINAWGGAQNGTVLRLHNGCRQENPDCTWTFKSGMLYSDRNPALNIVVWGGVASGAEIRLATGCQTTTPTCTWTYRDGMFVSNANPSYAISAWGGARYGTVLKLAACRSDNPDCTWSR